MHGIHRHLWSRSVLTRYSGLVLVALGVAAAASVTRSADATALGVALLIASAMLVGVLQQTLP